VKNGDAVQAGDLLAVLENPAKRSDVAFLDSILQIFSLEADQGFLEIKWPSALRLGSLQASYAEFAKRLKDLQYYLSQDINYLKISNLRKQIQDIAQLNSSLQRQEKILVQEVALAQSSFTRDSILFKSKSLSQLEFERTQAEWLARRRELESLRTGTSQNALRIREMQAKILDLQQAQSDGESQKMLEFRAELQRLKGEVDAWKQAYLLLAPVAGEVALTKAWSEQQQVTEGTEVMTIVPQEGAGVVIAKAMLPNNKAGKVKEKMPVHIRLDGFPYQEFGVLNVSVVHIASVPSENGYELEIAVPADLKTSYAKQIPFRQEMPGIARIVTEKQSLLERLFGKLRAALQNG
jgi:HlyD family secretion protein